LSARRCPNGMAAGCGSFGAARACCPGGSSCPRRPAQTLNSLTGGQVPQHGPFDAIMSGRPVNCRSPRRRSHAPFGQATRGFARYCILRRTRHLTRPSRSANTRHACAGPRTQAVSRGHRARFRLPSLTQSVARPEASVDEITVRGPPKCCPSQARASPVGDRPGRKDLLGTKISPSGLSPIADRMETVQCRATKSEH
jgi:hypothetical protein